MLRSALASFAAVAVSLAASLVLAGGPAERGGIERAGPDRSAAPTRGAPPQPPPPRTESTRPAPPQRKEPQRAAPALERQPVQRDAAAAPQQRPTPVVNAPPEDCGAGTDCFERKQAARQQRYEQEGRAEFLRGGCPAASCANCGSGEVCFRCQCVDAKTAAPAGASTR